MHFSFVQVVQAASILAVVLKLGEQVGAYAKGVGREHRARRLREEILSLQELRKTAPPDVTQVIDRQLHDLYQTYIIFARPTPQPAEVYPTLARWRKVFLLYIPARKWAMIPQLLFFLYVGLSPMVFFAARQERPSELFKTVFGTLVIIIFLRDWAIRSERPRKKRTVLQNIFLAYSQSGLWRVYLVVMYYFFAISSVILLTVPPGLLPGDWKTFPRSGLLFLGSFLAAFAGALHDYVRSYDVEPRPNASAKNEVPVTGRAAGV